MESIDTKVKKMSIRFLSGAGLSSDISEILNMWRENYVDMIDWQVVCDDAGVFWVFAQVLEEVEVDA